MGVGVSLFLMAGGAILAFAINASVSGVDIHTVGVILMIVGALGLLVTLVVWAPPRSRSRVVQTRIYDEQPPTY